VEAGSNPFTMTLRVVGGDEKGSLTSERVIYIYIYIYVVASFMGLGTEKDCAGENQQQL
jgi:hypothetical protein